MAFCNNHDKIYFDTLCRTKKAETLLSLIHATYQTKINSQKLDKTEKEVISDKLEFAYELFKFDSGTYSGDYKAFQSQYTIGHEMGIWENSELDLTPLATKVATGDITINDYFSIVFLNYIQPVKGKILHILHQLLTYMYENNLSSVTKEQMAEAYNSFIPDCTTTESINSVFNFMIATSYFKQLDKQELIFNPNYDIKKIINSCDVTYLDETQYTYEQVKEKFSNLTEYLKYLLNEHIEKTENDLIIDFANTKGTGTNKIYYGVPGCGKSYHIENVVLKDYKKENVIRTTFYQDYSNTDFVGQILPKIVKGKDDEKDTVEYIFNPGPFTLALIQAISNPNEKVALVVEEINRGNAPAIFGDIFQLLDRDDNSISEYGIVNVSMIDYLSEHEFIVDGNAKHYNFKEIKIPGNMDIFATMNTSDQNVYTLDTAFTRRWNKERISNSFNGNEIKDFLVPGMDKYTWEEFVGAINLQIQNKLDDLQVNEDKQVGAFFVKKSDLLDKDNTLSEDSKKEKAISFAHKVLEYLWDDVSKLDHTVIFNPNYKTFEKVVEDYLKNGASIFNNEIFKNKSIEEPIETND